MSDKPYTPDTIDIKVAYCSSFDPGFAHKFMAHMVAEMTTGHAGDFDRWLAEHDRKVRAGAVESVRKRIEKSFDHTYEDLPDRHPEAEHGEGYIHRDRQVRTVLALEAADLEED